MYDHSRPRGAAKYKWRGYTLVELLVVIAIIALLVAILVPAVQRSRASARSLESKSHLAQMGKGLKHYEGLGQGNLKATANWQAKLLDYVDSVAEVYVDPSDTNGSPSYAMSSRADEFGAGDHAKITIIESDDTLIVIDTVGCAGGTPDITGEVAIRHQGMTNALLYDGSVHSFESASIDLNVDEPLVVRWLPTREHSTVCGNLVVITNPNPVPTPSSAPSPSASSSPTPSPGNTPCDPAVDFAACFSSTTGFLDFPPHSIRVYYPDGSGGAILKWTLPLGPTNPFARFAVGTTPNAGSYVIETEDSPFSTPWSWDDLTLEFTRNCDGTIRVNVLSKNSSAPYYELVDAAGDVNAEFGQISAAGQSATFPGDPAPCN